MRAWRWTEPGNVDVELAEHATQLPTMTLQTQDGAFARPMLKHWNGYKSEVLLCLRFTDRSPT